MVDVQDVIASLTKFPFAQRSTESLYAMAENTQRILKAWQDEYLFLDARTAPHSHPPKKPCNGGRIPINPPIFEDMKEAEIYSYVYDPKKPEPGLQDPFIQRPGHEKSGGRELRQRRARDMLDSAAPSEEEEEEDDEGRRAKRQRRATRRFEGSDAGTGTNTPKKHNGKYAQPAASATPEPADARGKRARGLLHARIQEMREESTVTSSGDEGSSNVNSIEDDDHTGQPAKRGGRGGSRGGRGRGRGAYATDKGPRKRLFDEDAPMPSAHAPNGPPPALQSMSEGQNQFTLDGPVGATVPPPVIGPHSTETVFQATPQPLGAQDVGAGPPPSAHTPDTYMNTTPLSQYSNPYDDSANNSASGSRKKPRVKSEKRSQSMTIWWAERKARQKEIDEKNGTPPKPPTSRSNSGTGRRGGRTSAAGSPGSKPPPEPQHRQIPFYPDPHAPPPPQPSDQQPFHSHPPPHAQPFSAPSPSTAYASAPMTYPPPPSLVLQPTPLAALPTAIPPPPPGPGRTLAPAPLPPHLPMAYPSPYGPRTAPKPKSTGPPPLAPAPPGVMSHVSPYPPLGSPMGGVRDMTFKVLLPGVPPESRRGSRS
ncbi:hypothetical protein N0V90_005290 [Kalmusia sp. IMI 367209]|nr:hypothetical protein N0V90_005290 [Kalmusia sp. IMI 367209]